MNQKKTKSPLEKFLNIFTEVQAGEGVTAVLLFINLFILLTAYYIMKPVREALILAGSGAEIKSYSAAGQAILLLFIVPLYGMLAGKVNRMKLINIVTAFFTACLVFFYIFAEANMPVGVVFFLWVGIFNLMVIAQFWAFANDLYTPHQGKRIFVIVAFGASSGAVFGSFLAGLLIEPLGVNMLLLASAALLIVSLVLTNIVNARQSSAVPSQDQHEAVVAQEPIGKGGAFRLVFKSRYLLLIAFLMLFLNWVNTTGEYILGRTVAQAAQTAVDSGTAGGLSIGDYIGKFYAQFFTIVNICGLLIQLFLVSRILKYLGVRIALMILPLIALGGYGILAFYPVLAMVRLSKITENSLDYSLQNTVRQVLFLPTSREEKYKAKQAIDTFFVRTGDVLSAVLVFIGTKFLFFQTEDFAKFNLVLVAIWLVLSVLIGYRYIRMVNTEEQQSEHPEAA